MGLTYTSNLLHITLNGIIKLIAFLLTKINLALTVGYQNDIFEGEVGLYPQLSRGNYHISVRQVLNSLTF